MHIQCVAITDLSLIICTVLFQNKMLGRHTSHKFIEEAHFSKNGNIQIVCVLLLLPNVLSSGGHLLRKPFM